MKKADYRQTLLKYLRAYRADIHRVGDKLRSRELVELYAGQLRGFIHASMTYGVISTSEFATLSRWVGVVEARYYAVTLNQTPECRSHGGA